MLTTPGYNDNFYIITYMFISGDYDRWGIAATLMIFQ